MPQAAPAANLIHEALARFCADLEGLGPELAAVVLSGGVARGEFVPQLAVWVGDIADTAPPQIMPDTHLVQDLGLDSLALAELAAKARMRFKVRIRPGELVADLRAGAVADLLLSRL